MYISPLTPSGTILILSSNTLTLAPFSFLPIPTLPPPPSPLFTSSTLVNTPPSLSLSHSHRVPSSLLPPALSSPARPILHPLPLPPPFSPVTLLLPLPLPVFAPPPSLLSPLRCILHTSTPHPPFSPPLPFLP